ncbi:hypothetical protein JTE90_014625 [Oedothorax gibbosus]|uniref:Peptidase M13 N-terminal domain-containing protein n=1 Tax=Oedothorax gibbosus TaxID=931172 RepID=A0AAV6V8M5_9ARAC|nr:hypothetical protein JTE90_014625 [Oedothorax gibbosus]
MEVYEIEKNSLRRQPSTSPPQSNVKIPYLLSIFGIILITSGALVILHFWIGYRNLKEYPLYRKKIAEKFYGPQCDDHFCSSKECVSIASRLQDLMQPEADPCLDFYEFSCGGYGKSQGILNEDHVYTPAVEAENTILIDIRKVMEDKPKENESQTLQKLKKFYNSCLANQSDSDRIQSLRDWFSEVHLSFDDAFQNTWRTLVARLEEYGIHTIFTPTFKGSSNVPIETIEVDCNLPLLQPDVYMNPSKNANSYTLGLYKDFLAESVKLLLDLNDIQRKEFMDNVLQVETSIARTIHVSETRENVLENILPEEQIQNVKEIWRSTIGDSVLDAEVVSTCKYNLESILTVLENETPKASTTYVAWRMLLQIVPHLDRGFENIPYRKALPFLGREFASPWQKCAHQLQEEMSLPTFKALLDAGYVRKERIQEIKDSFKEAKRNFLLTFKNMDWAGALIRKLFLSKVFLETVSDV